MTEVGLNEWYDERWQDMDPAMRRRAAETVFNALSYDDIELICRKYREYGPHDWIHHLIDVPQEDRDKMNELLPEGTDLEEFGWPATWSGHHGFGTQIRNLLRDPEYGAGISDDQLPFAPYEDGCAFQNWDDYYVSVVEAAVGLREV